MKALSVLALSFPLATVSAQDKVWVVDAAGGAGFDFTDVQPAVDAASPWDVILVRDGGYGGVVIDKAIAIYADAGAAPTVGVSRVDAALPFGSEVVLHGLTSTASLTVDPNAGLTIVQDCEFVGNPAIGVTNARLVARETELFGTAGVWGTPGNALRLVGAAASAMIYDCDLTGDTGWPGGLGASGAYVQDGFLFAEGCSVQGGDGGPGTCAFPPGSPGGDGGDGFISATVTSSIVVIDCDYAGGQGGAGTGCSLSYPGANGLPVSGPGAFQELPGPGRLLTVEPVLREGETMNLQVSGLPGDVVLLGVSTLGESIYVPSYNGPFLVEFPMAIFSLGSLDITGTLTTSTPMPQLAAADSDLLHLQVAMISPSSTVYLGENAVVLLLDDSF